MPICSGTPRQTVLWLGVVVLAAAAFAPCAAAQSVLSKEDSNSFVVLPSELGLRAPARLCWSAKELGQCLTDVTARRCVLKSERRRVGAGATPREAPLQTTPRSSVVVVERSGWVYTAALLITLCCRCCCCYCLRCAPQRPSPLTLCSGRSLLQIAGAWPTSAQQTSPL